MIDWHAVRVRSGCLASCRRAPSNDPTLLQPGSARQPQSCPSGPPAPYRRLVFSVLSILDCSFIWDLVHPVFTSLHLLFLCSFAPCLLDCRTQHSVGFTPLTERYRLPLLTYLVPLPRRVHDSSHPNTRGPGPTWRTPHARTRCRRRRHPWLLTSRPNSPAPYVPTVTHIFTLLIPPSPPTTHALITKLTKTNHNPRHMLVSSRVPHVL
jgi:hypothetical protein